MNRYRFDVAGRVHDYVETFRPTNLSSLQKLKMAENIERLRKLHSNQLGFVPKITYMKAINRNRIIVATHHQAKGNKADWTASQKIDGYLFYGRKGDHLNIYQLCVGKRMRFRGIGATLVIAALLGNPPAETTPTHVRARCAEDLDANDFWEHIGFDLTEIVIPNNARSRQILIWDYYNNAVPNPL